MSDTLNILIVDDEQVILAASRRILEIEGFSVRTAGDAETALQMMSTAVPDIVVVDLKLPGMSGLEFLVHARVRHPATLVILATGYATANYAVSSLAGGAFDYLPKPFAFQELLSPIRRACNYLALPEEKREPLPISDTSAYSCLGNMTWAKRNSGDQYLVGLTKAFLNSVGSIREIAFPSVNELIHQGSPLAKVTSKADHLHFVWSPLSGLVIEINTGLQAAPEQALSMTLEDLWIARIRPADPEHELKILLRA